MPPRSPFRRLRPQLRARIIATYAIGALIVASLIGVVAYYSARSTILGQAINADELTTESNAKLFTPYLDEVNVAPGELQSALQNIDAAGGEIESASAWVPAFHSEPAVTDFSILEGMNPPVSFAISQL
ncbi:MAG TPA: hypothetical protein VMD59_18220, partial [Acidimicrobiales bacterium]|nr:hypothetical protein [Acidimicrobiales bacterium]